MIRQITFGVMLCWAHGAWAHGPLEVHAGAGPQPWTNLNVRDDGDKFQFAIVTDRTGGARPGVFESAVEKLNLLQPAFVLSVGDLIEGGAGKDELIQQWNEFDSIVDQLQMPFFYVPGNHDVSNSDDGRGLWEERVGPLYYHFLYKDVLFICMNSDDDTLAKLGDAQIAYVKKALADNPNVRWTFLFYHKPIFTADDSRWNEIEAVLAQRPHTVFSGHRHDYMKYERHTRDYFVLGTTGASMAHEGPQLGEFDHVVWVTVDQGEPQIANLLLDGILDKNVRTDWAAALSLPLLQGGAVSDAGVRVEDDRVESLAAHLTLKNPLDVPLQIIGRLTPTDHLTPEPQRFAIDLAPHVEQVQEVELNALAPVQAALLQSMVCEYAFLVQPPDKPAVMFSTSRTLFFDTEYECLRLKAEPLLDGVLNEVEELPLRCLEPVRALANSQEWQGAEDASFAFLTAKTQSHLYIAVRVQDDTRLVHEGWRPWKQDGLEIRLDARSEANATPVKREQDKTQEQYLYVAANPFDGGAGALYEADKLPAGCQFVCVPTNEGFIMEGVVPLSYLIERQGKDWDSFRLNVTLYDFDELSDSGSSLSWRPDWLNPPPGVKQTGRFHRN